MPYNSLDVMNIGWSSGVSSLNPLHCQGRLFHCFSVMMFMTAINSFQNLGPLVGFEPTTLRVEAGRSCPLSYRGAMFSP